MKLSHEIKLQGDYVKFYIIIPFLLYLSHSKLHDVRTNTRPAHVWAMTEADLRNHLINMGFKYNTDFEYFMRY